MSVRVRIFANLSDEIKRDQGYFEDDVKRAARDGKIDMDDYQPVAIVQLGDKASYRAGESSHYVSCDLGNGQYRRLNGTGLLLVTESELAEHSIEVVWRHN